MSDSEQAERRNPTRTDERATCQPSSALAGWPGYAVTQLDQGLFRLSEPIDLTGEWGVEVTNAFLLIGRKGSGDE